MAGLASHCSGRRSVRPSARRRASWKGAPRLKVWVDDWQLQCCGIPFAIGEEVTWTLHTSDLDWLTDIFGPERAAGITHAEEHHGRSENVAATRGRVVDIAAAACRYTAIPDGAGTRLQHVSGSGVLEPVVRADGWDTAPEGSMFIGYVVEFEAYA